MAERPASIEIRNWSRFQHYKKRNPPWIRLYRDLLDRPEYRSLSDSAARLLYELWLLASEFEPGGHVPYDVFLLAWRTGRASADASIEPSLQELAAQGFIRLPEDASANASADASTSTPQRQRTETEYREQIGPSADVENSGPANLTDRYREAEEDLLGAPDAEPSEALTISGITELANERLGLNILPPEEQQRNRRLVTTWNGQGRDLAEIEGAIEGLAAMVRDRRPEVSDWLQPGKPIGLRALQNTNTLYDQGDGRAQRPLWDVAYEYYQQEDGRPTGKRGGGLQGVSVTVESRRSA